ncbi:histidine kinase A domain protein [Peptostreptococcaceae bacterium AS15]|nr:histidine kinase A domain protein [[Eubacterium] yurii subsp. margaretiae ATCC 43715]EJP23022.1 histidine kinase A domain protein [Peptostreptococcaceae bacterium AS15]
MIYFFGGIFVSIIAFFLYVIWHKSEQKRLAYQIEKNSKFESTGLVKKDSFFLGKELIDSINILIVEHHKQKKEYEETRQNFKSMVTTISHDFRTPLTSISGYVQILLDDDDVSYENRQKYLKIIESRAISLSSLIEDFYTVSSIDSLDYPYILTTISLSEILREQIATYYVEIEKRYSTIEVDIIESPCYIISDRTSLQRIFSNLIKNALSYGIDKIKISLKEEENGYKIEFANSLYENADKNIANKIFERNYSVNWASSSKSTGLGLSIAKSMTEKMGGSIGAEVLDDMLVFTIEFEKAENHSNEMV